jgi:xylan 1,4-beta-xylosidase
LSERPGHLRLYGRESIGSLFEQALVARRQQAFCYSASTMLDFSPSSYQQAAGLVCYYNGSKFHYLHVTWDEELGRQVSVMSALPDQPVTDAFSAPRPIPASGRIELRAEVDCERLLFAYRMEGEAEWTWFPEPFDASILSDEATQPGLPNFTGAFVGVAAQDSRGTARAADFDWFDYRERDYSVNPG